MADIYYQTASGSIAVTDNPANVPPGASIITLAQYNTALANWQTTQNNAATAEQAAAEGRYTTVYAALRSMGMSAAAAQIVAAAVGKLPAVDPETNVKAMTQSSVMSADRTLTAASGTWEQVTELPAITIQETGLYKISWTAHGQVTMPAGAFTATTKVGVFKAAVILPNTETKVVGGVNAAAGAALGILSSGAGDTIVSLNSGDVISMYAQRVFSAAGSSHFIYSNVDGRTRLAVERIRPA